jgi:hypothetical protein
MGDHVLKVNTAQVYCEYLALKRHFSDWRYDYFQYLGKMKVSESAFNSRRDMRYLEAISRHHDPFWLMLAGLVDDERTWPGEIAGERVKNLYFERRAKVESLVYTLKSELPLLDPDFDKNLRCAGGYHPPLVRELMAGRVSIETASVLVGMTGCVSHWRSTNDPVLEQVARRCAKYYPFIQADTEIIKNLIVSVFKTRETV